MQTISKPREPKYYFLGEENKKPKTRTFRLSTELMDYVAAIGRKHHRKTTWQLVYIVETWQKDHAAEATLEEEV